MQTNYIRAASAFILAFLIIGAHAQAAPAAKLIEFWNDFEEQSVMQVNHDLWQSILNDYVDDQHPSGVNRFDYQSVSEGDHLRLKQYLDYLKALEPRQLNSPEAFAYWVNFYNASLVELVVSATKSEPISSIKQIRSGAFRSGPWTLNLGEVVMQDVSLDEIEHGILRPIWKDKRIHYVISSGSVGGGNILKTAFNGDNNEELLALAEKQFLSHERGVSINGRSIQLSSIFKWYSSDFAANEQGLLEYIKQHVSADTRAAMNDVRNISYRYNWTLNGL